MFVLGSIVPPPCIYNRYLYLANLKLLSKAALEPQILSPPFKEVPQTPKPTTQNRNPYSAKPKP